MTGRRAANDRPRPAPHGQREVRGFARVLIANRGEIAVRVCATLRRMGIAAVAVYSDLDAGAPHVRAADEAIALGSADGYLDAARVVDAALRTGAQAVHPGYGFLAENAAFARACAAAGLVFIGPPADAIAAMADKARARALMQGAGVPVLPGTERGDLDDDALVAAARDIGLPLMVKPVAGGGGKGMTVVTDMADLRPALRTARRLAAGAFGDDRLLLERYVERPRHIEVQVLADGHGGVVHLGERECSLQRRHQKIVEEAPSALLTPADRARIGADAVAAARAVGYEGAGTVEFIVAGGAAPGVAAAPGTDGAAGTWCFLEMNTRLQVEHPVTEMVTGLDLVEWQVRVAAGEALAFSQDDVTLSGHAVEARIYAEDPARGFLPTGGTVLAYDAPRGDGVRVDSGVTVGSQVPTTYDPLVAKVIARGADRAQALGRLQRALRELTLLGVAHNAGFLQRLLADDDVRRGDLDTGLVGRRLDALTAAAAPEHVLVAAALGTLAARERGSTMRAPAGPRTGRHRGHPPGPAAAGTRSSFDLAGGWRLGEPAWTPLRLRDGERLVTVRVQGRTGDCRVAVDDGDARTARARLDADVLAVEHDGHQRAYRLAVDGDAVWIAHRGATWLLRRAGRSAVTGAGAGLGGPVTAPLPGSVVTVEVGTGQTVTGGQVLAIVEAMKMEHQVLAPADGTVTRVAVAPGDQVAIDQVLLEVEPSP